MINKEAIVDPNDIIVLFETEIGEVKFHISVDFTNNCPYTVEVVWVRLWEVGGGDDVMTAEINIASAGTFGGGKQRVEGGERGVIGNRYTAYCANLCSSLVPKY